MARGPVRWHRKAPIRAVSGPAQAPQRVFPLSSRAPQKCFNTTRLVAPPFPRQGYIDPAMLHVSPSSDPGQKVERALVAKVINGTRRASIARCVRWREENSLDARMSRLRCSLERPFSSRPSFLAQLRADGQLLAFALRGQPG